MDETVTDRRRHTGTGYCDRRSSPDSDAAIEPARRPGRPTSAEAPSPRFERVAVRRLTEPHKSKAALMREEGYSPATARNPSISLLYSIFYFNVDHARDGFRQIALGTERETVIQQRA